MAISHQAGTGTYDPQINPDDFTTHIDNPYFPLRPGTTFVYEDEASNTVDTVTVTHQTVVIDGVTCVVVHDTSRVNGLVVEDTYDWFAQDKEGNVWYFGEDTREFEPGNPHPISTEGSWQAGVNGASPGIVMEADPQVGDAYRQEYSPGIAEDRAKVLGLNATVFTEYGIFDTALKTRDINPLDPSVENKYYVPGVGPVLTTDAEGGYEQLVRIEVNGLGGNDNLKGYAGGDEINGHAGHDELQGLTGNDVLNGGFGNDRLLAGTGGDRLLGGFGNDLLFGGPDGDTFMFNNADNGVREVDTIVDYSTDDLDVIDLRHGVASVAAEARIDHVWHLKLEGDGDVIRLPGVSDANHDGHIIDDLLIV